jgi:hypothetical protein
MKKREPLNLEAKAFRVVILHPSRAPSWANKISAWTQKKLENGAAGAKQADKNPTKTIAHRTNFMLLK